MIMDWNEFEKIMNGCRGCGLSSGRTNVVIGRGSRREGGILFVGEGPGENEDKEGLPFVGQAGRLLDLALSALEFPAEDYYIANVVKCRPPQNREPSADEVKACVPYLRQQFIFLKPRIVVALGSVALKALIDPGARITSERGKWIQKGGTLFTATYHPAALLRDESKKVDFYSDLRAVKLKYYGE